MTIDTHPTFLFMREKNRITAPLRNRMAQQLKECLRLSRDGNRVGALQIQQWIKLRQRKSAAGQRANHE